MPEAEARDQARKDATRGVLTVEAVAQKTIAKRVRDVAAYAGTVGLSPAQASHLIERTTVDAITKARRDAAARSARAFERQTGLDAEPEGLGPLEEDEAHTAAVSAAKGLEKGFREKVSAHLAEGIATNVAFTMAARSLTSSIERTATTEVMTSWNGEARRLARIVKADVLQTWHAELDACDGCAALDGKQVRNDEQFEEGDPPLHPRCRCYIESETVREPEESETRIRVAEPAPQAPQSFVAPPFATPAPLPAPTRWSKKALLDDAITKANERGVVNMNYLREGMRDLSLHRAAYHGATPAEVERIATGLAPAKNTGKILPPVKVTLDTGELILEDGRHRMTAAIEAGATNISATVRTYSKSGESIRRDATLSLRGRVKQ